MDSATRRLGDADVSGYRARWSTGRTGFNETLKIWLVHGLVRRRSRRGVWDRVAWGEPIHAAGMSLTNLAFLLLPLHVAGLLGMEYSEQELVAMQMLWRWIGCLMGVPDDLLPNRYTGRAASRPPHT